MTKALLLFAVSLSLAYASCTAQKKNTAQPIKEFKEDFSSFRPKYEFADENKSTSENKPIKSLPPKNNIDVLLKAKLDSLYTYNQKIVSADGYRILIYNGTSSEEARQQRNSIYSIMPFDKTYTEWKSPNFKVKAGDYIDKLEAYSAYARIVKVFPNAIVVPDKVNIIRDNN